MEKTTKEKKDENGNSSNSESPQLMRYLTRSGQGFLFDISKKACAPFGFHFGDRVETAKKKKMAWVVGVCTHSNDLWFHIDGEMGASRWEGFQKRDFERTGFKLVHRPQKEQIEKPEIKYYAPDLGQLLKDENFSDVNFIVGENQTIIPAHRAILSSRSQYFRAMFNSGMKESNQKEVKIGDIEPDAFRDMLEFLYTGDVKIKKENVVQLLVTATMFQIDSLSKLCYTHLEDDKLCSGNIVELLQVSKTFELNDLKNRCEEFILDNYDNLVETGGLKDVMGEHPDFFSENILKKLKPNKRKNDNREKQKSPKRAKVSEK